MSSSLSDKHFHDERAAYAYVESRVWPTGPVCAHCGNADASRMKLMAGKSTRIGVRQCNECRKPFTVKVGTIFESSHVPLRLWLQAIHLMTASKKGISSNQLHRTLGVTLKTAWFMSHRIRLAMQGRGLAPMGGEGATVEIDETVIGKQERALKDASFKGYNFRNVVLPLVERGGSSRSFHVDGISVVDADIEPIVKANIACATAIMTDEATRYKSIGKAFASHDTVNHRLGEYGRGVVTTNTVEGFYSIFKRRMKGVYQHCGARHLHRYLAEFDFRYLNRIKLGINDVALADHALKGIVGKRLAYQTAHD
ncbi:IS1595 family transposase [Methylocella tundrae]|uniref:Transposase n=1 Tax=Methylocella tundrae TaxID=227605 RepID=A0A4U8Z180_METTU|nr:IS1595 family transposase [Methylocella tundrae]WPP06348.1 IS1595 family transposase [Methylocella tundrae]VFU09047.1 transposase [Methylocella tundrae]